MENMPVGKTRPRALLFGGPTLLLEVGGLRLLTDPTFDGPGEYDTGHGYSLVKTQGPAVAPDRVGAIDAVLLSHDQHADNLDTGGRVFLKDAPQVLTTVSGAQRLGSANALPLPPWSYVELQGANGNVLRVTGLPAQHGPDGTEAAIGEVTGFLLSGEDVPTIYVSGDNASINVVRGIVESVGPVDIAVLFTGGARSPLLGDAYLTLNGERAVEVTRVLGATRVVPIHVDGWTHYSESVDSLRCAFIDAGFDRQLVVLKPGVWTTL